VKEVVLSIKILCLNLCLFFDIVSWFVVETIHEDVESVSLMTSDFEGDFSISISLLSSSGVGRELLSAAAIDCDSDSSSSKQYNLNPNNKDIFCKKPGLRYRKEAIQDHSKSKVHKAAELEENIQSISIPERGKNMHQKYFLLHLLRCIGWLKKRRQTTNLMH
jgi:hypothetical protein